MRTKQEIKTMMIKSSILVIIPLLFIVAFPFFIFLIIYLVFSKKIDIKKYINTYGIIDYWNELGYLHIKNGKIITKEKEIKIEADIRTEDENINYNYGTKTFGKKVSSGSGFDKIKIVGDNQGDYNTSELSSLIASLKESSIETENKIFNKDKELKEENVSVPKSKRITYIKAVADKKTNNWLNHKKSEKKEENLGFKSEEEIIIIHDTVDKNTTDSEKEINQVKETNSDKEIDQEKKTNSKKERSSLFDDTKKSSLFSKKKNSMF